MHTTAMLDYECLNCYWVNAHILDETIVVDNGKWALKSSLYLEQLNERFGEFAIYLVIYMSDMLVFDLRCSMGVFRYLI